MVPAVQADLATEAGIDRLVAAVDDRPVVVLVANAGVGLGGAFLDQDLRAAQNVVNLTSC